MTNNLKVKVDDKPSGSINYEQNEYIYSYQTEDKNSFISLTMPVRTKDYVHSKLHPIFEMHLPEGYLLSIIKKHFAKIAKTDDFGLLSLMSTSIKGRVTYVTQKEQKKQTLTLDELLHSKNEKLFDELVDKFALTSALSGVQPKVLAKVENRATLKLEDYIVKSWGEEYSNLALNEYYCMKIVKGVNIPVPEFYLSDDDKLFIMKRFDILEDSKALGFEDMCVLQAKQRDDKYEGTYEQIAKTIKTFVSPKHKKSSLTNFYKMIVISFLVQNGDAHLKNFGLLYSEVKDIKLAPAYDIVSTTVYIKNDIPALYLLGSKKWWSRKNLIKFAIQNCNLTNKEANFCFDECLTSLKTVLQELQNRLENEKNHDKYEMLKRMEAVFLKSIDT